MVPSLMLEAFRLLPRLNVELGTSAREKEEKFRETSPLVKYLQLVTDRVHTRNRIFGHTESVEK